jgi:hypothetical protein
VNEFIRVVDSGTKGENLPGFLAMTMASQVRILSLRPNIRVSAMVDEVTAWVSRT